MTLRARVLAAAITALAVALSVLPAACGSSPAPAASPSPADEVTLQLNWFHEAEFVGYYVADAKGFYRDRRAGRHILEGGPGDPAIDNVLDGTATSPSPRSESRRRRWRQATTRWPCMAAFQIPPLVIFSLSDSGITEPADLVGRRVGVTTDYWRGVLEQTLEGCRRGPLRGPAGRGRPRGPHAALRRRGRRLARLRARRAHPGRDGRSPGDDDVPRRLRRGRLRGPGARGLEDHRRPIRTSCAGSCRPASRGGGTRSSTRTRRRRCSSSGLPSRVWSSSRLAVRAVGPLVDAPQAPIGWIIQERWKRLMGDTLRSGPSGIHDELLAVGALTAPRRRSASLRLTLLPRRAR